MQIVTQNLTSALFIISSVYNSWAFPAQYSDASVKEMIKTIYQTWNDPPPAGVFQPVGLRRMAANAAL
jgi:hypothetical protein